MYTSQGWSFRLLRTGNVFGQPAKESGRGRTDNLELIEGLKDWPATSVDDLISFSQPEGIFFSGKMSDILSPKKLNQLSEEYKKKEKQFESLGKYQNWIKDS